MRSFTRAVVVGAMALPLAIGGAGIASADSGKSYHKDHADKCVHKSCEVNAHKKKQLWFWGWKHYNFENDQNIINAGIM
ncbi:hypothetical protein CDG81_00955 [Actinopolyspora erythraea]|uniref:Uncharacterized protein n=2 Tax=Actinopolyspora erythraea TaxID=414996 RepID=A0A099DAR0_9ACTN|nr:hypothetical protein CDG81_00955 [Actinopolyspora erythraea]KGI83184.1 hypothetical protein IL38_00710 [Actinopolyspora erythraea]